MRAATKVIGDPTRIQDVTERRGRRLHSFEAAQMLHLNEGRVGREGGEDKHFLKAMMVEGQIHTIPKANNFKWTEKT